MGSRRKQGVEQVGKRVGTNGGWESDGKGRERRKDGVKGVGKSGKSRETWKE